jgi:hypothetical protein
MAFGSVTAVYVRKQQQLQADRRSLRRKTHQKQQEISSQSNQPARERWQNRVKINIDSAVSVFYRFWEDLENCSEKFSPPKRQENSSFCEIQNLIFQFYQNAL